jgi:CheY-like chemotaxis protein
MESSKRLRILVVDDHLDSREVLAELLSADGHDVQIAANADMALETAREGRPPDLVFLDYVMPGMSAAHFVRQLKGSAGCENSAVVLLTGMDEIDVPGIDGVIRKPLPFDQLAEIIARYARL